MATTVDDVASLARAMLEAEAEVEAEESVLSAKKERLRLLREETIPCVMEELGLDSVKLNTGQTLSVKQEVYCAISKVDEETRVQAFQYLIDNNAASLIKTFVSIEFGKEEWEKAMALKKELQQKGLEPQIEQTVHPQTLKAYIKEVLANQQPIDLNLFGARAVMTAKLK